MLLEHLGPDDDRFGIRTFRPTLRKAAEQLEGLRTAEGTPLLENTAAELRRQLARLRIVREQTHLRRRHRTNFAETERVVLGIGRICVHSRRRMRQ